MQKFWVSLYAAVRSLSRLIGSTLFKILFYKTNKKCLTVGLRYHDSITILFYFHIFLKDQYVIYLLY